VTGVVYHDLDGDGMRDPGEPGLGQREVSLSLGDVVFATGTSTGSGSYVIGDLAPGTYGVVADVHEELGLCVDGLVTFDPIPHTACPHVTLPWTATQEFGLVIVEAGVDTTLDIGARQVDVAVVTGAAILEGDYAPLHSPIEALVGGMECGTTTAAGGPELFTLHVVGEGERAGCATPGAEVTFTVGGVPAAETYAFSAFGGRKFLRFDFVHLTAMDEHAWYWAEARPKHCRQARRCKRL
jgi:hypothetical protein